MIHIINLVEGYMPGVWWGYTGASRVKGNVAKISTWVDRWAWEEEIILICKIENKSPRKKKWKWKSDGQNIRNERVYSVSWQEFKVPAGEFSLFFNCSTNLLMQK